MTKFQRIQCWLCFIPFYSFIFIIIATYIGLARKKASTGLWVKFGLILFLTCLTTVVLTGIWFVKEYIIVRLIIVFIISTCANLALIRLQCRCNGDVLPDPRYTTPKKLTVFFLLSVVGILAFGLVFALLRGQYLYKTRVIADTNGPDDYRLNTITTERITTTKRSDYASFFSGSSSEGETTGVEDGWLEEADHDKTSWTAKSFNGVLIANATKVNGKSVTLEINSAVKSGNMAIMIYVDNTHYRDISINKAERIVMEDIAGKTVYVKAAGENASMWLEVVRIVN